MKKFKSAFLVTILLVASSLAIAFSGCGKKELFNYAWNTERSYYIVTSIKDKDTSGEVVVPATYNGKPIGAIARHAFEDCYKLTRIKISEGISQIGQYAFVRCNCPDIYIPVSVTKFSGAFDHIDENHKYAYNIHYAGTWEQFTNIAHNDAVSAPETSPNSVIYCTDGIYDTDNGLRYTKRP